MQHSDFCWISLGMFALQVLGLASVAFARVRLEAVAQPVRQQIFMLCWLLVGCATVGSLLANSGCWISCGTIFSVMAVGATLDSGNAVPASSF